MTLTIPPIAREDALPDETAVWRDGSPAPCARQVTVDYGGGLVERTTADAVHVGLVKRWRWGHAP